jgi:transposase
LQRGASTGCAHQPSHQTSIPAESPDLNPIENLWHELKEYIRREVKPRTKEQLIDGIEAFWTTVSLDKCRKYIRHLRKVIP